MKRSAPNRLLCRQKVTKSAIIHVTIGSNGRKIRIAQTYTTISNIIKIERYLTKFVFYGKIMDKGFSEIISLIRQSRSNAIRAITLNLLTSIGTLANILVKKLTWLNGVILLYWNWRSIFSKTNPI